MIIDEYTSLEQELSSSNTELKTFLKQKGIGLHKYYYWRSKSRVLKEESIESVGQFLPIDVQTGGLIKPSKRSKNLKHPLITQGEIEIKLRTPSGAEIRIRGYMDSIMKYHYSINRRCLV